MKPVSERKKNGTEKDGYLLWGLIAIELFMSFSFLGYVHIEPLSLTFVYIPVLVAGCIMGPKEAALVGAVFGLASMWKASAFYVGVGDAIFSPAMSGKPVQSIVLSVGARALFGLVTGFMYYIAKKGKHPLAGILVVSSVGRTIHSFLVYAFMELLFPEAGYTVANSLDEIGELNFFLSVLLADLVVPLCYVFRNSERTRKFLERIRIIDQVNAGIRRNRRGMAALAGATVLASFSVAVYFTDRIGSVMKRYGIVLTDRASYDLMHLQIQFLLGMIALALLVIIGILLYQKNFYYLYYRARMDGLTGLHGRRQFFRLGQEMLDAMDAAGEERYGCFLILDIDEFKKINDEFGHPEGDHVLKEVAEYLKKIFADDCILGRLGGDEFVVLVHRQVDRKDVEALLNRLKEEIARIQFQGNGLTCSIGVIPVEKDYTIEELYRSADRLLYEAKKKGKDQFAFGYRFRDPETDEND